MNCNEKMQCEWSDELFDVIVSHLPTVQSLIQFSTICKRSHAAVKNEWFAQFKRAKDAIVTLTIQPSSNWVEFARDSLSVKIIHPVECCVLDVKYSPTDNKVFFSFARTSSPPLMIMFTAEMGKDEVYISDLRVPCGGPVVRGLDFLRFIEEKALGLPTGMTLATLRLTEKKPDEADQRLFLGMVHGKPVFTKNVRSSDTSTRFLKRSVVPPVPIGPVFATAP